MNHQNTLQEVKERMKGLLQTRANQLGEIQEQQREAGERLEAATAAMSAATEAMDLDAYETAKREKTRARTALEMYGNRYNQIQKKELITEAESDGVIRSVLDYESELDADYKAALGEHLRALAKLNMDYRDAVRGAEDVLNEWQREIHANYRSATTVYAETGTNRSPRPVPVHPMQYAGCTEAVQLEEFLRKFPLLLQAE